MGYVLKNCCTSGFLYVPQFVYDGGTASRLSPSAFSLLVFFYRVLNRTGSPWFAVAEKVIERETGLCAKTIRGARNQLVHAKLVACARAAIAGAPYVFHLLNPETKEPFPFSGNKPAVYDPEKRRNMSVTLETMNKLQPRALHVAKKAKANLAQPESASKDIPPQNAPAAASKRERVPETVCSSHGDAHIWYSRDGRPHCGICEKDPFAPTSTTSPKQRALVVQTWDEMYNH